MTGGASKPGGVTARWSRLVAGLRGGLRRPAPAALRVETGPPAGAGGEGLAVAVTWEGRGRAYEVALYDHGRRRWRYLSVPSARAEIVLPEGLYHVAVRALHGPLRLAGSWSPFLYFHVRAEPLAEERLETKETHKSPIPDLARQQAAACWKPAHAGALDPPPRIVLVGGAPRSGTTLLQAVLCADPAANSVIAEAAPLRAFLACHAQILRHHRLYPETWFENEDALRRFTGDTLLRFLNGVSEVQKCRRLILKEPALTKWFPGISELIEGVGYVVIVRDPRDAIASMIDVAEGELKAGRPSFVANRNAAELAAYYNSFYAPLFNCRDSRFTRALRYVRYEDLVAAPGDAAAELGAFFGLDLGGFRADSPGWRSKIDFASRVLPSRSAVTGHYNQAVSTQSIGRYRTRLDAETVAEVEKYCFPIMAAFGYRKEA